jgi:hypothetical protein
VGLDRYKATWSQVELLTRIFALPGLEMVEASGIVMDLTRQQRKDALIRFWRAVEGQTPLDVTLGQMEAVRHD